MLRYLQNLFRRETPLSGAPEVKRLKTYSADSGYVFQYYFAGFRPTPNAYEYAFTATADRKTWATVVVRVGRDVLVRWTHRYGRELGASERFGVAKIALRRAFDVAESPHGLAGGVLVSDDELRDITEFLDLV